ncbi:glycosyltransferase [Clostridium bowmanii]|uniref:glycosyltransferase n=1 Tax=Clostridium bowmanii TaxID=132925 RepID=UPI001C0BD4A2|nr:glycosyltransferase [Clostridium bowmanii]MBU3190613.1 glycosyltransferase [Clostridium bowmanii]MCA1075146.1 glycosyltransferase [Clostridium bowmanii]
MSPNEIFSGIEGKVIELIENKEFQEVHTLIRNFQIGLYSMETVVLINEKKYYEAEELLNTTLGKVGQTFDLLYNLGYIYEITGRFNQALDKYNDCLNYCEDEKSKKDIEEIIVKLVNEHTNEPLVSVCMPIYNDEKDIIKAVNSVLNQTYKNFEIIICDNNSEDKTFQLLKSIKDIRIRLIRNKENIGWLLNSNKVMKLAVGEYVTTLHGDDYFKNTYIESVVNIFNYNENVGVLHFIDKNMKKHYFDDQSYFNSENYYSKIASLNCMPSPTQTAFRRKALCGTNYYGKDYWTVEARLSMEIAEQGFDAYIEGRYLFERYGGTEKDSSQIDKQILRFNHLFKFYEDYKNDIRINKIDLCDLKNNVCQSFLNIYKLSNIDEVTKKLFKQSKENLKTDLELFETVFDYIFDEN